MNYLLYLQELRSNAGWVVNALLLGVSKLVSSVIGLWIPALIYWCVNKRDGAYISISFAVSSFVNQTIKNVFCVPRPALRDPRIHPAEQALRDATGYSFPSGHTAMAMSLYGGVAVTQQKRKWLVAICVLMILLTGFSRNWLGVHTLWDVLAAMANSGLVLFVCAKMLNGVERRPNRDLAVAAVGSALAVLMLLLAMPHSCFTKAAAPSTSLPDAYKMQTDSFSSCGVILGCFWGWWIERRWVRFCIHGSRCHRALRFAFGAVLLALLRMVVLPTVLAPLGMYWGKFAQSALVFLCLMAGYPALFTWAEHWISAQKKTDSVHIP